MTSNSNDKLKSLFRQRVKNSSLVIYNFNFAGGFVTSSDHIGYAIMDSTTPFSRDLTKELPCTYFVNTPTNSGFEMINIKYGPKPRTEGDTLLSPINRYTRKYNTIEISVTEYNNTYGSPTTSTGLMEFLFDSLKETNDSLTFYNVTKKFGGKEFPSTTTFMKGNVKVLDSSSGFMDYIDISQVVIKRGDIYKPTNPLELVSDQPIVGTATYRFRPTQSIKSEILTDYGIFKRVK